MFVVIQRILPRSTSRIDVASFVAVVLLVVVVVSYLCVGLEQFVVIVELSEFIVFIVFIVVAFVLFLV